MKNNKLFVFLFILVSFFPATGICQSSDFGIWYGIKGEHQLSKKFNFELSTLVRTFNNASTIEQAFLEAGISYKIYSWLSITGAYRITENIENDDAYHIRHKWLADIKGSSDPGDFGLSGRLRLQRQDKTFFEDANDRIPDYYIRVKFKTEYKTPSFPVNPSISLETFSRVFEASDKTVDKYRIGLGAEYKINKKNSVELEFMYERDYLPKLSQMNILYLTYNFKL